MQYRVYFKLGDDKFSLVLSNVKDVLVSDGIYQVYSTNGDLLLSAPKQEVIAVEKL